MSNLDEEIIKLVKSPSGGLTTFGKIYSLMTLLELAESGTNPFAIMDMNITLSNIIGCSPEEVRNGIGRIKEIMDRKNEKE